MSRLPGQPGHRLGQLGLAGAGRSLDQDRLGQAVGQVDDAGDPVVGQVLHLGQPGAHGVDRSKRGAPASGKPDGDLLGAARGGGGVAGHVRTWPVPVTTYRIGGELAQAHRAPGVELLGRDADLGAEAELAAVDEAGRGVDHHGGGVHLGGEPAGRPDVPGDDGLRVARAVSGDVVDGGVEVVDGGDGQGQPQELGGEVGVGGRPDAGQDGPGGVVAHQGDPLEGRGDPGQERVGHRPVDDQRLGGVAHPGSLGLGVDHDGLGHVEVGGGVDVDVAVADPVDHVGHGGVLLDGGDERRAAPGDEAVDDAVELHEGHGRGPAGVLHQAHGVDRQPGLGQAVPQGVAATTRLEEMAVDEPRSRTALPDLRHSPAASLVTFGRFS